MTLIKNLKFKFIAKHILFFFLISSFIYLFPIDKELIKFLDQSFANYGIVILFVLSFLKNIVTLNFYFPGLIPIVYGISRTYGDINQAILTLLAIYFAMLIANFANVIIGSILIKDKKDFKLGYYYFFLTLWHPHLASLTSIQIGNTKNYLFNFIKYFIPVSALLYIAGGTIIYYSGNFFQKETEFLIYIFYLYLIYWTIKDLVNAYKEKNKNPHYSF